MTDASSPARTDRTVWAVIVGIVVVVPALLPAALFVLIYNFFFSFYTGGGSWIPYLHEIGSVWFPELVRGMIVGVIALATVEKIFTNFNKAAVRYGVICFWGAVLFLLIGMSAYVGGLTLEMTGGVALFIGLCCGAWASPDFGS